MDAYRLAKKYYPQLWDIERLSKLLEKELITEAEYTDITGLTYPQTDPTNK